MDNIVTEKTTEQQKLAKDCTSMDNIVTEETTEEPEISQDCILMDSLMIEEQEIASDGTATGDLVNAKTKEEWEIAQMMALLQRTVKNKRKKELHQEFTAKVKKSKQIHITTKGKTKLFRKFAAKVKEIRVKNNFVKKIIAKVRLRQNVPVENEPEIEIVEEIATEDANISVENGPEKEIVEEVTAEDRNTSVENELEIVEKVTANVKNSLVEREPELKLVEKVTSNVKNIPVESEPELELVERVTAVKNIPVVNEPELELGEEVMAKDRNFPAKNELAQEVTANVKKILFKNELAQVVATEVKNFPVKNGEIKLPQVRAKVKKNNHDKNEGEKNLAQVTAKVKRFTGVKKKNVIYVCGVCKKTFKSQKMALHHMKIHLNKYRCDECGKAFTTKYKYERHLELHSDERKFICEICTESFKRRTSLLRHQQRHMPAVFKCSVCGKQESHSTRLKRHMRSHQAPNMKEGDSNDDDNEGRSEGNNQESGSNDDNEEGEGETSNDFNDEDRSEGNNEESGSKDDDNETETHIHPGEDYDDDDGEYDDGKYDDGEYDDGKYDDGEYDDGAQTTNTTPQYDDINDIVVMVLFFSLVVLAACYMNTFRYKMANLIVELLSSLQNELKRYFPDVSEVNLKLIRDPFHTDVASVNDAIQEEFIDFVNDSSACDIFENKSLVRTGVNTLVVSCLTSSPPLHSLTSPSPLVIAAYAAHRIILAFFSLFFKRVLEEVCEELPMVVVFPSVNYDALQVIVAYMYRGQSQLDSVIASANNNECNTNSHLTRTGCAEMCMEGEDGIVELEVTEGEPHPTVSTNTSSFHTNTTTSLEHPTNNRIGLLTRGEDRTSTANIDATTTTTTTANTNTTTTTTTANTITTSTVSYTTTANTTNTNTTTTTTTTTIANTTTASGHVFIQPEDIQLTTMDDLAPTHIVKLNEDGSMGRYDTQTGGKKERKVIYKLTRYGPEDLQGALEDVRAGAGTLREIAGRWGVPHSTLSVNARLAGIAPQHHRSLDYDPQTLQAAKDAVRSGASYMKVAIQYNIPKSVLWRRCQLEAVVSSGVRRGGGGGGYGYAQRDLSVARQRLLDGASLSHIVKETKISKTTLFRMKEQLVREGRLPASSITQLPLLRRAPEESLRRAVAACRDQGLTHGQASEKFQVSKSTVWRRLKQETPEHMWRRRHYKGRQQHSWVPGWLCRPGGGGGGEGDGGGGATSQD
ncbi:hypothetical protein Pcinc_003018 [Petrolisthes cinctipes]|uniref:Uncharacterized protein n=1 Tax=Petrolisthes cinctipes TaxID=88211 RepID=A0AAE1GPB7_PETCI|nr:hypothetical protein Pcinc_003018 [Petrolisthes cinctipes]